MRFFRIIFVLATLGAAHVGEADEVAVDVGVFIHDARECVV
jgi:hypothetical protein